MKTENYTPEEKQKMLAAARMAHAIPEEQEFWQEVSQQLDKYDTAQKVAPRVKTEH